MSVVAAAVACAAAGFAAEAEPGCEGVLAGAGSLGIDILTDVRGATRWDPDGPGPEPEWLVLAGQHVLPFNGTAKPIAGWDGRRFRELGDLSAFGGGEVESVGTWDGRLVATTRTLSTPKVLVLDQGVWTFVGSNLIGGDIRRVMSFQGELVLAGNALRTATARSAVMVHRNGAWEPLGPPINGNGADLIEHEGELIVSGSFAPPSPGVNIAAWNGTSWRPLGAGLAGREVKGLAVFDGRLTAVGDFTGSGSRVLRNVASWSGSEWLSLGFSDSLALYQVAVYNDALVVGGRASLWRWDRKQWTIVQPTGSSVNLNTNANTTLVPFDGDLAICRATPVGGPYGSGRLRIARLVDWNLRSFARGPRVVNLQAIAQGALYQGKLFAAGPFYDIAGMTAKGVAVWDGVTWESAGVGLVGMSWPLGLETFSGGVLTIGDVSGVIDPSTGATIPTKGIARWDGVRWHAFGAGLSSSPQSLAIDGDAPVVAVEVPASNPSRAAILRWTGDAWMSLGELPGRAFDTSIAAENGIIAVTGRWFDDTLRTFTNYLARWDGQQWTTLFEERNAQITRRVGFHAGELYIMGSPSTFNGVTTPSFVRWDGASWEPVGDGPGFDVRCLLSVSPSELLVGGYGPSGARLARWDGERWTDVDVGAVFPGSGVYKLIRHHGEIVALGQFSETQLLDSPLSVRRINTGSDAWIAWQPKGMEIVCGGSTTLRARVANGYAVTGATWFRNGVPVVADRVAGVRVELDGGHAVLRLDDVSSDVAGTYRCVFETACGTLESDPAVVTVTGTCCPGDLTLDGVVDDVDFMAFAQAYTSMNCESAKIRPGCAADLDSDGLVGDTDFEVFALAYDAFVCPG